MRNTISLYFPSFSVKTFEGKKPLRRPLRIMNLQYPWNSGRKLTFVFIPRLLLQIFISVLFSSVHLFCESKIQNIWLNTKIINWQKTLWCLLAKSRKYMNEKITLSLLSRKFKWNLKWCWIQGSLKLLQYFSGWEKAVLWS